MNQEHPHPPDVPRPRRGRLRTTAPSPRPEGAFVVALLALLWGALAFGADVTILAPDDGATATATACPVAPCTAEFTFEVGVAGAAVDRVDLIGTPDSGSGFTQPLCTPPDPIEGIPGCPDPPVVLTDAIGLAEGEWSVVARATRGGATETSAAARVTVLPPEIDPAGPVSLAEVVPSRGAPPIPVRDPDADHPNGITTTPDEVEIHGANLDDNPFLDVFLAPIPVNEPSLTAESALPLSEWCLFQAEILGRGATAGGGSFLRVRIPELPPETPSRCGVSSGPAGSIFAQEWRWVIRDRWIRPEREHASWAIPSPRDVPWRNAPSFALRRPEYPHIHGFGFENFATDPTYNEFLTVFGNNAYLCVGALGLCATRLPDPLYHLLWWPIYRSAIGSTGGSCNGMSATSLLMAGEELQPEDFLEGVHFPIGFDEGGDPARFRDTNFCTPFCSPPKPDDLWATIRMNHGVQISREFLVEILDTLGEAIFDPDDLSSIKGVPNATLARVAADPQEYVLCFFQPGKGHCVTPYRVEGDRILVYDNNAPNDSSRFIEISGGDYRYPARTREPNQGNAIMAFPLDIWRNGRHLLGLSDLTTIIGGDVVEFLYMIAVGSGDMIVTNEAGGRWGWEEDGTFTDAMLGAVSIAPLGPPDETVRSLPLLLAMNQPEPVVRIRADGSGSYTFHTGAGGHLLQLESAGASAGDEDEIRLGYEDGDLASFAFTPQRDASRLAPRVGLAIGEQESALFQWLGLALPSGETVGFGADKDARAVTLRNHSGASTTHTTVLDFGAGPEDRAGRMVYGPFEVPQGASQRLLLANWPEVGEVVSEVDLDGDGTPDESATVTGRPVGSPLAPGASADLSVAKATPARRVRPGEGIAYTVTVSNAGPDAATDVVLGDVLPAGVAVSDVTSTHGTCDASNRLRCDLGRLAAGGGATVSYTATPSAAGTVTSSATVLANEGDPNLNDNSAASTVRVGDEATGALAVAAGSQNPDGRVTVADRAQDLPVVQLRAEAQSETVRLERAALELADRVGDVTLLASLEAVLRLDANGNGRPDAGEEVLARASMTDPATPLELVLASPLVLDPGASAHFLITLDVNAPQAITALAPVPFGGNRRRFALLALLALLTLHSPAIGRRKVIRLALAGLAASAMLLSCTTPPASGFTFTPSVPAGGVAATGDASGPLTAPSTPIRGVTVALDE